jgi:AraC-like DNA-binding protein
MASGVSTSADWAATGGGEDCAVSVRTLERFSLPAFGDTPRRWLRVLRMQRAVELLRDGSNVSETAFCLGYEDPSHFSREFKKGYGFAPKESPSPAAKASGKGKLSHSAMKLSRLAMKSRFPRPLVFGQLGYRKVY